MNRDYISYKKHTVLWVIILIIFLVFAAHQANGQEVKEYYKTNVCLTFTNGDIMEDIWEVRYDFDNINDLVVFNMRPNDSEEFTVIHKIYNIIDSFDTKSRLILSEYFLDDMAVMYIKPVYDNPEMPEDPTGCYIKLKETVPYSIRRSDIKMVEFNFFIYF